MSAQARPGRSTPRAAAATISRWRLRERVRTLDRADWVLAAIIGLGCALRVVASWTYWPTIPSNADSWPYAFYAANNPLADPQHPAGYSLFLAFVGIFTRDIALYTVLQHALGICTALVLYAAVKRLVGSPWPALVAAAFVLLNADQVFQEQTITSEWLFTALWALGLYATVRAIDSDARSWRWALFAGIVTGLAVVARTQGALLIPVFAIGLLLSRRRPWRTHWRGPAVLLVSGCAVLGLYGVSKAIAVGQFELGPSPGWQLYAHVAPFADCKLFTPPSGTAGLCESTPPAEREGDGHYLYDATSPAVRLWGHLGNHDAQAMAWALAVIEAQPGEYLKSVYDILRDYYVPSTFVYTPGGGDDIDGELRWKPVLDPATVRATITGMETFFTPFTPVGHPRREQAMYDYQRVFRFGGTLLTVTSLLTLLGLAIGPRRYRVGVFILGIGAVLTLLPQAMGGAYIGRYSVPLSGPMGASAAIVVYSLWQLESARRRAASLDVRT